MDQNAINRFSSYHQMRMSKMGGNHTSKHTQQLRATHLRGTSKVRSTYNQKRFEDWPPEVIYAEVLLLEVQVLLGLLYGTLVRFYAAVCPMESLDRLKEDILEIITSTVVSGEMAKFCLKLCRLSTREEEGILAQKFKEIPSVQIE